MKLNTLSIEIIKMNFILMPPSLEHRTSVNIAITLWSQLNFRGSLAKSFDLLKYNWPEIEEIVKHKASKLSLPLIMKERLLNNIRQVGLQILSWIQFHTHENHFINEFPSKLFWTPHGTIDNKRTAEVLTKDDNLSIDLRFKLACFYCLADDISDLKEEYYTIGRTEDYVYILFWLNYLNDNDDIRRRQLILHYVRRFALDGNETAFRYFFLQMNTQNGENLLTAAISVASSLFSYASQDIFNRRYVILCFLLSTMTVEQQARIFEMCPYEVLKSFLIWPRQSLFLEAVKGKWNYISKGIYYRLLHDIIENMSCKQNDFNELFGEFWKQTPEMYKHFVTNEIGADTLFLELRKVKDDNNIQLIINYVIKNTNFVDMYH